MKRTVIFDLPQLVAMKRSDLNSFQALVETFQVYKDRGYFMVMISAEALGEEIKIGAHEWLAAEGIEPDIFLLREVGDTERPEELKARWIDELGKDKILCAVESASGPIFGNIWQKAGIPCFQILQSA